MRDVPEAWCSICGREGPFPPFFPGASLRESGCPGCGSSRRNRDAARALLAECLPRQAAASAEERLCLSGCQDALARLRIFELQAKGALHDALCRLPGYVCSEFLKGVKPGERNAEGVLCQDAGRLTFDDASFDAVINQDVLEHMADPWAAFSEIARVLRPGGVHIFTIPLHEGRLTLQRARLAPSGEVEHLFPPVRHKDPLDAEGALVFWDYGDDLPKLLERKGIACKTAVHARFYEPEELCRVDDEEAWRRCLEACRANRHVSFFIYNSVVFAAKYEGIEGRD